MPNLIDMVQCKKCGTWYVPQFTPTGRLVPHCLDLPTHQLPRTGKLPSLAGKLPERGSTINLEV